MEVYFDEIELDFVVGLYFVWYIGFDVVVVDEGVVGCVDFFD